MTGDARALERRVIQTGTIVALWVPTALPRVDQLRMVMRDLGLAPRAPRCMACGGALRAVAKAEVLARIPPRTARWKDDYFVCVGCGQLFWQGTHWERIRARLAGAGLRSAPPPAV